MILTISSAVHPLCQDPTCRVVRRIAKWKAGRKVPFVTCVTDLGEGHPFWFHPEVDRYDPSIFNFFFIFHKVGYKVSNLEVRQPCSLSRILTGLCSCFRKAPTKFCTDLNASTFSLSKKKAPKTAFFLFAFELHVRSIFPDLHLRSVFAHSPSTVKCFLCCSLSFLLNIYTSSGHECLSHLST